MGNLIVHVGYPKCASTLLQREVFKNLKLTKFINNEEIISLFLQKEFSNEQLRQSKLRTLAKDISSSNSDLLISNENFSMPNTWLHNQKFNNFFSREESTKLIKKYFCKVKVIIIIRNQCDWIYSWYQERVKYGETKSLNEILNSEIYEKTISDFLNYQSTINFYERNFGSKNVFVLGLKNIVKQQELKKTIKKLFNEDIKINHLKRINSNQGDLNTEILRFCNKFLLFSDSIFSKKIYHLIKKILSYTFFISKKIRVQRKMSSSLFEKYSKQNQNLNRKIQDLL